ncbi:MAG: hypothetical protein EZS28_047444, partial [Streblomastix strix]
MNVDISDFQGTVGQPTGLQPSSGAQSPGLNAGLRLKEAGSISASNREKTQSKLNEGHEDNAMEEQDEQTDEAALNQKQRLQNQYNLIAPVQENLGTQLQNDQGLNAMSQTQKDDSYYAPVDAQEKPKKGRGSKKSKQKA